MRLTRQDMYVCLLVLASGLIMITFFIVGALRNPAPTHHRSAWNDPRYATLRIDAERICRAVQLVRWTIPDGRFDESDESHLWSAWSRYARDQRSIERRYHVVTPPDIYFTSRTCGD